MNPQVVGIETAARPSGISKKIVRAVRENQAGFSHPIFLRIRFGDEPAEQVYSLQLRGKIGAKYLCKNPYPADDTDGWLIANLDGTAWFTGPSAQCCQLYWMEQCGEIKLANQ